MQNQQKIKDPVSEENRQETVRQNWDEKGRKTDIQIIKKNQPSLILSHGLEIK